MGRRLLSTGVVVLLASAGLACQPVGRASIPHGGGRGAPTSAPSSSPSISADGAAMAFASDATDLTGAPDTNGASDVFVRDFVAKTTTRVSVATGGAQGSGASTDPAISADGNVVAFTSTAADLVAGDTNGAADVFVHDRTTGTTTRISVATGGAQGSGASTEPAISADGNVVAFTSTAADLVAGDTNGAADVFVHDRTTGTTTRVSVTGGGAQVNGPSTQPSVSGSGEWIAFASTATNVVSGDSNGASDVFVARRSGGDVQRLSAPDPLTAPFQQSNGASSAPSVIDPIGGYTGSGSPLVAYQSGATNLAGSDANGSGADVFVSTRLFGSITRTVRLSDTAAAATGPSMASVDDGPGFVVAYARAGAGLPGGGDVVGVTRSSPLDGGAPAVHVADVTDAGDPSNGPSDQAAISADGRIVAFRSTAGDLVGRTEAATVGDVYVGRAAPTTIASVSPDRVGAGETRVLTVTGSGFDPSITATFDGGISVDAVTFVSSTEIQLTVTGVSSDPATPRRGLTLIGKGAGGSLLGSSIAFCAECVEVSAVVDQAGPVDILIDGGSVAVGSVTIPVPSCIGDACIPLPATVGFDGDLGFGLESVALDPIDVPVELIPGVETTIQLVPRLDAPSGHVIPATGDMDLSFGLAIGIQHALLPSSCAIGPVQVDLSAGPSGDPLGTAYDQLTGEAVLAGGFTSELAVTGCGFFTGTLNTLLGLPVPIAENSVTLGIRLDPVLTGTATP